MKCLNLKCENEVPIYRACKQTGQISKWYFCNGCIHYCRLNIEYPCFGCTKILTTNQRQYIKFCSTQCKSRYNYNTKPSEAKLCKQCGNGFISNLGYRQDFCGKLCRVASHRMIKNLKARKKYRDKRKQMILVMIR